MPSRHPNAASVSRRGSCPVCANAAGGKAELLVLPEIGIKGNTHMLMQDDNSLDIADILLDWIGKHVTASAQ